MLSSNIRYRIRSLALLKNRHTVTILENIITNHLDSENIHRELLKTPYSLEEQLHVVFNSSDVKIIEQYGTWLHALQVGIIKPITEEQQNFVEFVSNEQPKSFYQNLWHKVVLGRRIKKYIDSVDVSVENYLNEVNATVNNFLDKEDYSLELKDSFKKLIYILFSSKIHLNIINHVNCLELSNDRKVYYIDEFFSLHSSGYINIEYKYIEELDIVKSYLNGDNYVKCILEEGNIDAINSILRMRGRIKIISEEDIKKLKGSRDQIYKSSRTPRSWI